MYYVLSAIGAYLLIGLILTYNVLVMPRRRRRLWDIVLGAMIMPVLALALLLFALFEELWKRLLIALDYNPPEEMRAGPKPATESDGAKPEENKPL